MTILVTYVILVILTWILVNPFKIKRQQLVNGRKQTLIFWIFITFTISIVPLVSIVVLLNASWRLIMNDKNEANDL